MSFLITFTWRAQKWFHLHLMKASNEVRGFLIIRRGAELLLWVVILLVNGQGIECTLQALHHHQQQITGYKNSWVDCPSELLVSKWVAGFISATGMGLVKVSISYWCQQYIYCPLTTLITFEKCTASILFIYLFKDFKRTVQMGFTFLSNCFEGWSVCRCL